MEEISLRAVKRAMPGHGRVRANVALLETLGIEDNGEIEISNPDTGKSVYLTVFADELVGKDEIRISEDDLKKIGTTNGESVQVRKKPALSEKIGAGVDNLKEKIGGVSASVSETVAPVSEKIGAGIGTVKEKAGEISHTVSEGVAPIGERIHSLGAAFEHAVKRLQPGDAAELKKLLANNEGEIKAITVRAPTAVGRTLKDLTVPSDLVLAAVQRDADLVVPVQYTALADGDIVYVIGKEKSMEYIRTLLEG